MHTTETRKEVTVGIPMRTAAMATMKVSKTMTDRTTQTMLVGNARLPMKMGTRTGATRNPSSYSWDRYENKVNTKNDNVDLVVL